MLRGFLFYPCSYIPLPRFRRFTAFHGVRGIFPLIHAGAGSVRRIPGGARVRGSERLTGAGDMCQAGAGW